MRFGDHTWLWASIGILLGLALAYALDFTRRRRVLERIGHATQLSRMAQSVSRPRRVTKAVLLIVGVSCLALALARPQVEGESRWRQRGIDIALVIDFSKSMQARDVRPNRLARARFEADALLRRLGGDRVAVIAFAGGAVHYPLTTDYEAAKILYHGLSPYDMAPGSDLAGALVKARCLLRPDLANDEDCKREGGRGHGGDPLAADEARREHEGKLETTDLGDRARAIVVLTDGEITDGDANAQVAKAAQQGIEVFVLGMGTAEGAPIPEFDDDGTQRGWKQDDTGANVISRLDEPGLIALAKLGGGEDHYYRVHPGRVGIDPIHKALARFKDGEVQSRVVKKYNEAYQWLLFPAFLALIIEACLSDRRRQRQVKQQQATAPAATAARREVVRT